MICDQQNWTSATLLLNGWEKKLPKWFYFKNWFRNSKICLRNRIWFPLSVSKSNANFSKWLIALVTFWNQIMRKKVPRSLSPKRKKTLEPIKKWSEIMSMKNFPFNFQVFRRLSAAKDSKFVFSYIYYTHMVSFKKFLLSQRISTFTSVFSSDLFNYKII